MGACTTVFLALDEASNLVATGSIFFNNPVALFPPLLPGNLLHPSRPLQRCNVVPFCMAYTDTQIAKARCASTAQPHGVGAPRTECRMMTSKPAKLSLLTANPDEEPPPDERSSAESVAAPIPVEGETAYNVRDRLPGTGTLNRSRNSRTQRSLQAGQNSLMTKRRPTNFSRLSTPRGKSTGDKRTHSSRPRDESYCTKKTGET